MGQIVYIKLGPRVTPEDTVNNIALEIYVDNSLFPTVPSAFIVEFSKDFTDTEMEAAIRQQAAAYFSAQTGLTFSETDVRGGKI